MLVELFHKALHLPSKCLVNQKLPKAFFKRNFDLILSEKKLLADFSIIRAMEVLALINPETANITFYNDDTLSYEEIIILAVQTTSDQFESQKNKIIDLIHKYIPNPILLVIYDEKRMVVSVAEKRINSNDLTKRVIEKTYVTENIIYLTTTKAQDLFLSHLAFDKANKLDLRHYYNHFIQSIIGLQTAQINGTFVARSLNQSKENIVLLEQIERLKQQTTTLENTAKKETQIAEMVKWNAKIQQNRNQIKQLTEQLITEK